MDLPGADGPVPMDVEINTVAESTPTPQSNPQSVEQATPSTTDSTPAPAKPKKSRKPREPGEKGQKGQKRAQDKRVSSGRSSSKKAKAALAGIADGDIPVVEEEDKVEVNVKSSLGAKRKQTPEEIAAQWISEHQSETESDASEMWDEPNYNSSDDETIVEGGSTIGVTHTYGTPPIRLPMKIIGCPTLSKLLSMDTWNSLTPEEQDSLKEFLPTELLESGTPAEEIVAPVLSGHNIYFGSPLDVVWRNLQVGGYNEVVQLHRALWIGLEKELHYQRVAEHQFSIVQGVNLAKQLRTDELIRCFQQRQHIPSRKDVLTPGHQRRTGEFRTPLLLQVAASPMPCRKLVQYEKRLVMSTLGKLAVIDPNPHRIPTPVPPSLAQPKPPPKRNRTSSEKKPGSTSKPRRKKAAASPADSSTSQAKGEKANAIEWRFSCVCGESEGITNLDPLVIHPLGELVECSLCKNWCHTICFGKQASDVAEGTPFLCHRCRQKNRPKSGVATTDSDTHMAVPTSQSPGAASGFNDIGDSTMDFAGDVAFEFDATSGTLHQS